MEPQQALDDLIEISNEVQTASMLGADGTVLASTLGDERAREVGRLAHELLATADGVRRRPEPAVSQIEVAMRAGSVFVVRDGGRVAVATTAPEPTTGLVLYDLRACLRGLDVEAGADAS